ncbi:peptidylprolyl isomerase [Parachlamydia sp. AcF125]|uniref:peptidylprolyl isomerase n=1 Tax=Parachlamydia sp. AcF125 TaxID=2795736 RepID=UPI001BCA2F86|nr:peptidylprolyl isomerase [Parachlamydia sp. AcF125]MBS4168411.1 Peptidyl-prolyl cis-trans isomerase B [Parachlamydia sp. AcF125]
MKTQLFRIALALFICGTPLGFATPEELKTMENKAEKEVVIMATSLGEIKLELFSKEAPLTVKNFLDYVESEFYDHTIFHRVIDGFMIQGGGFTKEFQQKPTKAPIKNEAGNNLSNKRGTIAMARTSEPNSATAQFFINVADNHFLDHRGETPRDFGYCVFGQVISGMNVVDQIRQVKTGSYAGHSDVPKETVEIISVRKESK